MEDLNYRERYWQEFYDVLGENGLNCMLQECGGEKKVISEETRNKISNANKGKKRSEESKQKMSESRKGEKHYNYGKPLSEEHKKNLSQSKKGKKTKEENPFFGKTHTEETRKIMSQKSRTKTLNPENIIRFSNWVAENIEYLRLINGKVVLDTQTGVFYNSIKEAAFYVDMHDGTLGDQLRGRYTNKTNLIIA
jgi:group I intron endonuclease